MRLFNVYYATDVSIFPENKTRGFLMFSGGIEKDEWHDWTNLQSVNKPISEIYFAFIFFVCER